MAKLTDRGNLRLTDGSFKPHTVMAYRAPTERAYGPFLYACLRVYPTRERHTFGYFDLFSGRQFAYVSTA